MTNTQLYIAIALPIFVIITSLIISLFQISGIRDNIRQLRTEFGTLRSGHYSARFHTGSAAEVETTAVGTSAAEVETETEVEAQRPQREESWLYWLVAEPKISRSLELRHCPDSGVLRCTLIETPPNGCTVLSTYIGYPAEVAFKKALEEITTTRTSQPNPAASSRTADERTPTRRFQP